jgi:hypothetical protein
MPKFLFVYRGGRDAYEKMPSAEREQMMQRWRTWLGDGMRNRWLLDAGDGLKKERRIVSKKQVMTDGPYAESKEVIGGFSIVQADTLDDAAELAKGCPVLLVGGTVEVGPLEGFTMNK